MIGTGVVEAFCAGIVVGAALCWLCQTIVKMVRSVT